MTGELPKGHEWQPEHLRLAVEAAGVALWAWNVDTDMLTMDAHGFELWGMDWSDKVTFEELSAHIHPLDRDRVARPSRRPGRCWGITRPTSGS